MAKKFKVKTEAVFNGQPPGSTIELDEAIAKKYEAMKYLEIISEVKPKSKPAKKSTKKQAEKKTKDKE